MTTEPEPETLTPDVSIEMKFDGSKLQSRINTHGGSPIDVTQCTWPQFLALYIQKKMGPISEFAHDEWMLLQACKAMEAEKAAAKESKTPRLVSASGGLLN